MCIRDRSLGCWFIQGSWILNRLIKCCLLYTSQPHCIYARFFKCILLHFRPFTIVHSKPIIRNFRDSILPVSYTHLDVYKRQHLTHLDWSIICTSFTEPIIALFGHVLAQSVHCLLYTSTLWSCYIQITFTGCTL